MTKNTDSTDRPRKWSGREDEETDDHAHLDVSRTPEEDLDWVMERQQEMAAKEAVSQTKLQLKNFEKEQKDRRHALLEAVRASAPDIRSPLVDKLESLSYEKQAFKPADVVNILKAADAPLKEAADFFDLNVAQREDLLDRVGFYRGVIIDNRLSDPVEAGFYDLLMRPDSPQVSGLSVATPLYRKPGLSGYFENFFTSSEEVHQTQKSGVTNLDFSLSVAFGLVTSVGVGVSTKSYKREDAMSGSVGKMVYTTANFFLPKIELSFDNEMPCASPNFCAACEEALLPDKLEDKFAKLTHVLSLFGHFVAKETLVGGRLFATESKTFDGKEAKSDLIDRFAAQVKVGLNAPRVEVEGKLDYEKSSQTTTRDTSSSEVQNVAFQGVGGEGTVVQNASLWATSLYDYKRWSAVQRENLIPSLDVLPAELSADCWKVLARYATTQTKQALFSGGYSFLFYGKYGTKVGTLARDIIFGIANAAFNSAIALEGLPVTHGGAVTLAPPASSAREMWRITQDGHIVSMAVRAARVHGQQTNIAFAMAANVEGGLEKETYAVCIQQLGQSPYQIWDDSGSGEITNRGIGSDYVLDAESGQKLILRKRSDTNRISRLWNINEFSDEAVKNSLTGVLAGQWFTLRSKDGKTVMSIVARGNESELDAGRSYKVVPQPDVGGLHQIWRMTSGGEILSALKAKGEEALHDVLLSVHSDSPLVFAECSNQHAYQRWVMGSAGISLLSGKHALSFDAIMWNQTVPLIRVATTATKDVAPWRPQLVAGGRYSRYRLITNDNRQTVSVKNTNGIRLGALIVNGVLTKLGFEHSDGVQLTGKALQGDKPVDLKMAQGNYWTAKWDTGPSQVVNQNMLYLPRSPIYAISLFVCEEIGGRTVLGLAYQEKPDSRWISAGMNEHDAADYPRLASTMITAPTSLLPKSDDSIFGIGLVVGADNTLFLTALTRESGNTLASRPA